MIAALGSFKSAVLAFNVAAIIATRTEACQKLEGLYQLNVTSMSAALAAYQQCAAGGNEGKACSIESHDLITAQEELQAIFSNYVKTCAARLASGETAGPAHPRI